MMSSFDTVTPSLLKRIPSFKSSNHSIITSSRTNLTIEAQLTQIQLLEEVVALVVDDDESREIHHVNAPDRLHAEFRVFHHLDLLDAVFGEIGCRTPDRTEIEAAVLLAGLAHRDRAVTLGHHHHRSARCLELVDKGIHPS